MMKVNKGTLKDTIFFLNNYLDYIDTNAYNEDNYEHNRQEVGFVLSELIYMYDNNSCGYIDKYMSKIISKALYDYTHETNLLGLKETYARNLKVSDIEELVYA